MAGVKKYLCILILAASSVFSNEFHLKDRLAKAKSGDYIVAETGKTTTLLAIRSVHPHSIVFEEISIPTQNLPKVLSSWSDWVKARAPGHSSWSMTEIDPSTGNILECYSFSRSAWVQLSKQESLLATILQLPLQRIGEEARKKIGPPPLDGESDHRKIWAPTLIFEGKTIDKPHFSVFETFWPHDGSELSSKKVSVYFDEEIYFPLPYWVQIDTTHATGHMRTVDAGKNLSSPHRSIPRRVPQFASAPQKTERGLKLTLKSPLYYRQFDLFAIDVTEKEKQFYPLVHSTVRGEGELVTLEVAEEDLNQTLTSEHRYTWLVVPTGYSEAYTEFLKPFTWSEQ